MKTIINFIKYFLFCINIFNGLFLILDAFIPSGNPKFKLMLFGLAFGTFILSTTVHMISTDLEK